MRLINADELKENITKETTKKFVRWDNKINLAEWETFTNDIIDNAPTVENDFHRGYIQGNVDGRMSADRSEGTWIYKEYNYTCSNCGNAALEQEDYPYLSSYCPFCGAEMEIEP